MLNAKNSGKNSQTSDDLNQLLSAIESATHDTSLLALNMALEGANAGAGSAAELADAVGELSIRANQFSHQIRGCLRAGGSKLDSHSWSEVRRVTRGVAELIGEVSGLAGDVLEGIADPVIERRLPEVAPDLLDQVRSRAHALDRLLHALPDLARGTRPPS
jgi:methyl-accepting chemotaxis protein